MINLGDTFVWFKIFESSDYLKIDRTRLAMFWHQTKRDGNGCWIWQGHRSANGYSQFGLDGGYLLGHRVSYAVKVAPIPDGMLLRHRCDQKLCVNYGHLEPGTHLDNARDKIERRRMDHLKRVSDEQVIEMRVARAAGATVGSLARAYKATSGMVSSITSGRQRRHVGGPLTKPFTRTQVPT